MRRLALLRHGSTAAVRAAAFGADEPLDERGLAAARALAGGLPRADEAYASPAARARQTASAVGLSDVRIDRALAECDFGRWTGRSLAHVHAEEPDAATAWMSDPDAAPHGGEPLSALIARVRGWLAGQAERDGRAIAVTHGGVVKAAVVCVLDAPALAFWRVDVAPLSLTELHAHDGRWTLARVNAPAAGGAGAA